MTDKNSPLLSDEDGGIDPYWKKEKPMEGWLTINMMEGRQRKYARLANNALYCFESEDQLSSLLTIFGSN